MDDSVRVTVARRWRALVKATIRDAGEDRVTLIAAGVTFNWFLALFPLLYAAIALLALAGPTSSAIAELSRWIRSAVPAGAAEIILDVIERARLRSAEAGLLAPTIALLAAIWAASSGMVATQVGLNTIAEIDKDRGFLRQRATALGLLAAWIGIGGVAIAAVLVAGPLADRLTEIVPAARGLAWLWAVAGWLLGLTAIAVLFTVLYAIAPNRRPPNWIWFSPGALLATALWGMASFGFSLYLTHAGGSYARTYGSLAGVVVLLLWLYVTALAVLIGAELNQQVEERVSRSVSKGIAFDAGHPEGAIQQDGTSQQIVTYTCGHEVRGPRLEVADSERLDVERRKTEDTA